MGYRDRVPFLANRIDSPTIPSFTGRSGLLVSFEGIDVTTTGRKTRRGASPPGVAVTFDLESRSSPSATTTVVAALIDDDPTAATPVSSPEPHSPFVVPEFEGQLREHP